MSFDAIVIGAGHNGLAAAVHLASQGWKVMVVEGNADPGGAVKTREVTLPGFRHDLCAMNLSNFAGSAFCARYRPELEAHGMAFAPAKHCFASVFRDGTALGVSTDLEETVAAIRALSPEDAQVWRQMVAEFQDTAPHLFGLLGSPMPSWPAVRVLFKAWRQLGVSRFRELIRLVLSSPRDFLDRHYDSPKLKAMMAAWGLHVDFPPDAAGGALFPYLESMANQSFGMVVGQGGADTVIRAMVGLLKSKQGELITGVPVQRILTRDGVASGVVLADGREFAATRAIIANAHPRLVFENLLAATAASEPFRSRIREFRAGLGTMMIHLALDSLPDWAAGEHLKRYAYVHVAPDLSMMSRVYNEAAEGLLPAEPVVVVGQPTAIDPTRAPDGKHVLWLQVRVLPAVFHGDALGEIIAADWEGAKDNYADRVLQRLEQYAPGLRNKILARHVMSPTDLEQENPNLIGGDNLGGSHHLDQNFIFRPVAGYSRYRTPVKSLYLCGASTWPGAGTGAGSGFMLANMLLK